MDVASGSKRPSGILYDSGEMSKYFLIKVICLVLAAWVVAAAAGCGGGGSSSTVAGGGEATTATGATTGTTGATGRAGESPNGAAPNGEKKAGEAPAGGGAGSTGKATTGKRGSAPGGTPEPPQSNSKPSPEQISNLKFVRQVRDICAQGKKLGVKRMAAFIKSHQGQSKQASPQLLVEAIQSIFLPGLQSQVDEIRALGTPPGDEAKVEAFLAAMEEAIEASAEATGPSSLSYGENFKREAELANEYGIHRCAYG
jgi:hypothetical protein